MSTAPVTEHALEPLAAVIYRSTARVSERALIAQEAVEGFAARNLTLGLGGFLHLEEGQFLQLLEGPQAAVAEIYASIKCDPRHFEITELFYGPVLARRFRGCAMGFSDGEALSLFEWAAARDLPLRGPRAAPVIASFLEDVALRRGEVLPHTPG